VCGVCHDESKMTTTTTWFGTMTWNRESMHEDEQDITSTPVLIHHDNQHYYIVDNKIRIDNTASQLWCEPFREREQRDVDGVRRRMKLIGKYCLEYFRYLTDINISPIDNIKQLFHFRPQQYYDVETIESIFDYINLRAFTQIQLWIVGKILKPFKGSMDGPMTEDEIFVKGRIDQLRALMIVNYHPLNDTSPNNKKVYKLFMKRKRDNTPYYNALYCSDDRNYNTILEDGPLGVISYKLEELFSTAVTSIMMKNKRENGKLLHRYMELLIKGQLGPGGPHCAELIEDQVCQLYLKRLPPFDIDQSIVEESFASKKYLVAGTIDFAPAVLWSSVVGGGEGDEEGDEGDEEGDEGGEGDETSILTDEDGGKVTLIDYKNSEYVMKEYWQDSNDVVTHNPWNIKVLNREILNIPYKSSITAYAFQLGVYRKLLQLNNRLVDDYAYLVIIYKNRLLSLTIDLTMTAINKDGQAYTIAELVDQKFQSLLAVNQSY